VLYYNVLKNSNGKSFLTVYFEPENPFPEVTQFIQQSKQRYGINLKVYKRSIKEALQELLDDHPTIKAIFIGTRKTDPFSGELKPFTSTDKDWPQCMRIFPILDWNYHEIWAYLLSNKIPYCSLYDQGYTSLGTLTNTLPNEYLRTSNGFNAAFDLEDPEKERNGR